MEKDLIGRLEAAVSRLEAISLSSGEGGSASPNGLPVETGPVDPAILAFDDFVKKSVGRLVVAGEKIGGKVVVVSKILEKAFATQKELLVKVKRTKVCEEF